MMTLVFVLYNVMLIKSDTLIVLIQNLILMSNKYFGVKLYMIDSAQSGYSICEVRKHKNKRRMLKIH